MSVLLVDIGNTRIKWSLLHRGRLARQQAAAHAGWTTRRFERALFAPSATIERVLVSSVAGPDVDRRFERAVRQATGRDPVFVRSTRRAGGITTRYVDPWRLGVDRFVGAIGAHALVPRRAVLIANVGTALTVDLVDGAGVHHGGVIVPGPELMVSSLLEETSGIRRRARGGPIARTSFARDTLAALEQGARLACAAVIDRAAVGARRELRTAPRLVLTGGALKSVRPFLRTPHQTIPDLVLRGLAVLAAPALP